MKKRDLKQFVSTCRNIFIQEAAGDFQTQQFLSEASDYQIAHLAIKGKLPTSYSKKTDSRLVEQISYLQELHPIDSLKHMLAARNAEHAGQQDYAEHHPLKGDWKHPIDTLKNLEDQHRKLVARGDQYKHDFELTSKHPYLGKAETMAHHAGNAVSDFASNHMPSHDQMMGAGAVALAAAGIAGAYGLYKHFVDSNTPHAVAGKHGLAAVSAAKAVKQKGRALQVSALQKSLAACSKSKNPNACRKILQDKIRKVAKKA